MERKEFEARLCTILGQDSLPGCMSCCVPCEIWEPMFGHEYILGGSKYAKCRLQTSRSPTKHQMSGILYLIHDVGLVCEEVLSPNVNGGKVFLSKTCLRCISGTDFVDAVFEAIERKKEVL